MGRRWQFLGGIILTIGLLLCSCAKADNQTCPTANQNSSPVQSWRSSEYCLRNKSSSCGDKYTLTMSGWLNVTAADGATFCEKGGCAEHSRAVLQCIAHVKRDFWFANSATVKDLNDTINNGCNSAQGFTGTSLYNSHGYRLNSAPIVASLVASALLLMALF